MSAEGGLNGKTAHIAEIEDNETTPLLGSGASRSQSNATQFAGTEWEGLPWSKRPSVYWLLGPFVLTAIAFGGILVPKVNLILGLICREYFSDRQLADPSFTFLPIDFNEDNPQCRIKEVQARVSMFTLACSLISGLLSAIIAPKLGALSDRYGRKMILCITTCGMLCGEIITIITANFPETINVNFILLSYGFDGLCGSFIASTALSHSYATDCTPPNKRNVVFGYFHGCLFTGVALGPLIAAYVVKWTGTVVSVFYIALGFHIFFLLFLIFFIPESLSKSRQMYAREKHRQELEALGPAGHWMVRLRSFNLFAPLKVLYPTGPGSSPAIRRNLLALATVDTIIFGLAMGAMSCVILYINYEFGWDTSDQSIFIAIVNICRVFTLVIILPGLNRAFRGPPKARADADADPSAATIAAPPQSVGTDGFELAVIRAAVAFDALGFLGYALARHGAVFMFAGAVTSVGGMGSPTLQAALTKHVRPDQVGQLLGAMGLLHAVARVVSPSVFNSIYAATVGRYTQAVFVVLASMFGVAFVVAWFAKPGVKIENEPSLERESLVDSLEGDEATFGI